MFNKVEKKASLLGALALLASSSAFAFGGNAAIVYNPQTGQWGSAHGATSRQAAEQNALGFAGLSSVNVYDLEDGAAGLIETYATNGWVALAIDGAGNFGTGGVHDSEYDAEQSALANCGNANCYVLRSTSSYVDYADQDGVRP